MSESLVALRPLPATPARLPALPGVVERPTLEVVWARHQDDVRAAQRLRYQVFAQEMGARLQPPPGTPEGLDADHFDAHCEHLLVRTVEAANRPSQLVGTYRVMMPAAAQRLGGYYSDGEFDLSPLGRLRPYMAELGRSCVHADWRRGAVILLMWSRLAEFMHANGVAAVIGCASIPMADGGHTAASVWEQLRDDRLVPQAEQVQPRVRLPVEALRRDLAVEPPALIKGYLKCGARVLGAPAWDPDFNTADLPLLLRVADLPDGYKRRFMGG
jgi:putative hemolysin